MMPIYDIAVSIHAGSLQSELQLALCIITWLALVKNRQWFPVELGTMFGVTLQAWVMPSWSFMIGAVF